MGDRSPHAHRREGRHQRGDRQLVISLKGQAATASFQQTYSADKLREKSRKTLELQRVEGRWLIRKESAGG